MMDDRKYSSWDHKLGQTPLNASRDEYFGQAPPSIRGYRKIADAVTAFNFSFKDKVVLDIGSSTGGFTQYALEHGAKKVIAIEKGTNQMLPFLRNDPRVELHEKTDIFNVRITRTKLRGTFATTEASEEVTRSSVLVAIPDIVLADVSFISLRPILSHMRIKKAEYLVMLKPQFEAKPSELNKGVVKNEKIRRNIIRNFETWLKKNNYIIIKKHDNVLTGRAGNLERFYYLTLAK